MTALLALAAVLVAMAVVTPVLTQAEITGLPAGEMALAPSCSSRSSPRRRRAPHPPRHRLDALRRGGVLHALSRHHRLRWARVARARRPDPLRRGAAARLRRRGRPWRGRPRPPAVSLNPRPGAGDAPGHAAARGIWRNRPRVFPDRRVRRIDPAALPSRHAAFRAPSRRARDRAAGLPAADAAVLRRLRPVALALVAMLALSRVMDHSGRSPPRRRKADRSGGYRRARWASSVPSSPVWPPPRTSSSASSRPGLRRPCRCRRWRCWALVPRSATSSRRTTSSQEARWWASSRARATSSPAPSRSARSTCAGGLLLLALL